MSPPSLDRLTILVVDDERDTLEFVARFLQGHGAQVRLADSAAAAVAAFDPLAVDVVVSDIGMPGTDGYSVCRRIREADPDRRIILVALTGFGQAHDRARALTAGFDAHLTKPADVAALHGALAHVCPRRVR